MTNPPQTELSGETVRLLRGTDWSRTPLGARETWPQSLNLAVAMVLAAGFPMAVQWGPELVLIYNDAYGAILGDKHPQAFGRPLREVWAEIHAELGPLNEAILRGERGTYFAADHPWAIRSRTPFPEPTRLAVSYSPIPDAAAPSGIGGVLAACIGTAARNRNPPAPHVLERWLESGIAARVRDRIWELSEDLLGLSNFDGYFISVNPAWTRLLGWSEDEITGMHVDELRHPEDQAQSIAARRTLADGAPSVRLENRFRHKDGSWRWIDWAMTAENGLIYLIGRHVSTERMALRESERAALQSPLARAPIPAQGGDARAQSGDGWTGAPRRHPEARQGQARPPRWAGLRARAGGGAMRLGRFRAPAAEIRRPDR